MTAEASESRPPGQYYCPSCERMYPSGEHCPEDGTRLVRIKAVVDPLLGRVLDERYTIIEKLGQGGMGAVYRAAQHSVGREVAIKVVNAHLVSDPDAIRRFLREAKIASRLSHPNAVGVLDFGQSDDGLFYLVMELVMGRTLDQVIKGEKMLRYDRLVRIGSQVCDALEGAHALQIVHRDLKPANIMLLAQGRDHIKVLDFGLAKSVAPDQATTTMTNAGALLGTPAFMPPELALGEPCDGRADLYALGCILYLCGSGRLPFVYDSPHELIAAHGHEKAPPMTGVPPALAAVIDRLLEKDPARRFQTANETREALEAALEHQRMSTPSPFGVDTSPSLGPFPAPSEKFRHLRDTPLPSRRTPEADAFSDTIATPALTLADHPPRRRWGVPILVAFALVGGGLGALVAMRGGETRSEGAAGTMNTGDTTNAATADDTATPSDTTAGTAAGDTATPRDATKPGDATKTSDATKPGDATKSSDATKSGDATKTSDATKSGDATKTGDATKPATTKPATTKPATTKPATTKPATTRPATTRPATTRPATTKPATTKPATTRPATTKPATTRPATTKPPGNGALPF